MCLAFVLAKLTRTSRRAPYLTSPSCPFMLHWPGRIAAGKCWRKARSTQKCVICYDQLLLGESFKELPPMHMKPQVPLPPLWHDRLYWRAAAALLAVQHVAVVTTSVTPGKIEVFQGQADLMGFFSFKHEFKGNGGWGYIWGYVDIISALSANAPHFHRALYLYPGSDRHLEF